MPATGSAMFAQAPEGGVGTVGRATRRRRVDSAHRARILDDAVGQVERIGHGIDERRHLLEQWPNLVQERRCSPQRMGRNLHERIVPRQAGLESRGIVQPPWREDLGLVQLP